jgi:tol-pal system protein YbgF
VEANPPPERTGFGSVTVSPDGPKDEIDRILNREPAAATPASAPEPETNPKQLYETAYGYLLQRDYGAAESAFDEFLRRHPNDPLAGNAQYWLGESLYVRGQYRAAAGAFLKGYQTYGKSAKAPESLLKLAMSLQRLGQKDAACSSFNELSTRFPSAPAHVKSTAQAERQRAGCQ